MIRHTKCVISRSQDERLPSENPSQRENASVRLLTNRSDLIRSW